MNPNHQHYQEMLDLRKKGLHLEEIGLRFGVTRQTVRNIIGNTGELSAAARFWRYVNRRGPNQCWQWLAGCNDQGYGRLRVNGEYVQAHRFSWELHNGPIPEGMMICHTCDFPGCVNPAHLFLGTASDNMQDMVEKGRGRQPRKTGEEHGMAKLTEVDVVGIRKLASLGVTQRMIARIFGITQGHVSDIVTGKKWGTLA